MPNVVDDVDDLPSFGKIVVVTTADYASFFLADCLASVPIAGAL